MEKNTSGLLVVLVVFGLLIGGLVGFSMVPVEIQTETVFENQTVTVEVPGPEVKVADIGLYFEDATDRFLNELDDEDELECNEDSYSLDEVSVDRDYKYYPYSVTVDEDSDGDITETSFEVRLEFDADNDERSCKQNYEVTITEEEDEDTEFKY